MMGIQDEPAQLFYDFCLDDHVPGDHMLRGIDRFLDLGDVREKLRPFYRSIGRPSIPKDVLVLPVPSADGMPPGGIRRAETAVLLTRLAAADIEPGAK
ncbi:hypothetical protein FS800_23530 [Agrobacterium vitis]|uniref:Transposase InsH N-terminal domain-containing protein n=1 Tax=Agrobacterium vitis TaxID=373 RepID=A0ABD6HGW9_AGRVI|nr:hypothetical protein [Allorhizobium ampelinum]MCF1485104.1 hypothetical protein [Allorhizobium ampelinum]MUO31294.1 hypothetical protein [Agrobacterium vitis]MUO45005.1 hypothetical protein [Agrobacterium vitis]MUP13000.1 hypothetical protein [Agrobacterium vitis]